MADLSAYSQAYIDTNNSPRIVGVVGVFHFLAMICVALRVYARYFMVKAFGVDDVLIVVAVALAFGSWLCLVLQIPYGLGRHGIVVPTEDRVKFERIGFYKTVISDGLAMGFLRISMAISILRLNRAKWYRYSLFALMGFVFAYTIQSIVWLFVYCKPFAGWWLFQWANPFDPRCHSFTVFLDLTYWNIACNIFTDVCLGALPVPAIWQLKLRLRVRIYVIVILNLGYLAVLMGILKAIFMLTTGGTLDTITGYWVHFWQNLQLNIGIIAACASFLKPLVGRVLKLNSSAYYYPSNPRYANTPRTGMRSGSAYERRKRRNTAEILHDEDDDTTIPSRHEGIDSFGKNGHGNGTVVSAVETDGSGGAASPPHGLQQHHRFHAERSQDRSQSRSQHRSHDGSSSANPMQTNFGDSNSEEIMLQELDPSYQIVRTRDVRVEYSAK